MGIGKRASHEVTTLRTPTTSPLLITQRITHTTGGRALALVEARLSGDDTQLTYTLPQSRKTPT
jgi:DNA-binding GntR family transcriptional regulator